MKRSALRGKVCFFFEKRKQGRFNGNHAAKPSVKQAPKSLDLPVK